MENNYINLTAENIDSQHICCAIADKKHQDGVQQKKQWLIGRIKEGHVFRKLDAKAKVFIEYAPLETAWVPIEGDNYLYIYCLWVSGSYKGKGYAKELLQYCIDEAKQLGKSGVCILSSKKKSPFLSEKKFMLKFGFTVVDSCFDDYELLALKLDNAPAPIFKGQLGGNIESKNLTIYYGMQCPYIPNCILQVESYCKQNNIQLDLISVDSLDIAKSVPCIFNNWAVFYNGEFKTVHLLNEGYLKKLLGITK